MEGEKAIFEMSSLREKFCKFCFEGANLKIWFLKMHFLKIYFENLFFIIWRKKFFLGEKVWKRIFWGSNFQEATPEIYFLRDQFQKCLFWGSNFQNAFFKWEIFKQNLKYIFKWGISKIYSLRQQFLIFFFRNVFFEGKNFENVFL